MTSHTTVHLVSLPESLRETCEQAIRSVFPQARVKTSAKVADALQQPAGSRELLVLGGRDEEAGGIASQVQDEGDLPRWAVVHLGNEPSDMFETVPPEDWKPGSLGRIFRSALMQHELLRENLRLRGDLKTVARRVTHDQRTPLGCILTVCEALRDPSRAALSTEEAVDAVRVSANELSRLTDHVSLVLKATLDPLPSVVINMGTLLPVVLAALPDDAARKRLRLPAEWPDAVGVPAWVEFTWTQLIDNALRHGRTGPIQLGSDQNGDEIRFWVSSPGVVPPIMRPRLMRSFNLLHKQAGVGLSLSLIERLIDLQGGHCGYEATEDNRSLFFFTLPAVAQSAPEKEKVARSVKNLATS